MFHPHRSFSGVLSSPNSTDMSEGAEPDAKATEVAASPSSAAAKADDEEWVPVAGEDTPLVGRKIEVVVKDEHEKADVTTTAVTDEGECGIFNFHCTYAFAFASSSLLLHVCCASCVKLHVVAVICYCRRHLLGLWCIRPLTFLFAHQINARIDT